MLSEEIERFICQWMRRAQGYADTDINGCYDKFFTLFLVFNRLYAEATFELARRGDIKLKPNGPLPDKKGATECVWKVIGRDNFDRLYRDYLEKPVQDIAKLIDQGHFHIILSSPDGDRQPDKDQDLVKRLRSSGETRALAVLELVYKIRCNLFHGHKGFDPVQTALLRPAISILEQVIQSLHRSLLGA